MALNIAKQFEYALAVALTKTGRLAQAAIVSEIRKDFKIRTSWTEPGNAMGVKVLSATRNDPSVAIVTRADWLNLHEEGGIKKWEDKSRPKQKPFREKLGNSQLLRGRHYVALATRNVRTFEQPLPARLKPGRLKKPFVMKMKSGRLGIFIRVDATGKRRRKKGGPIVKSTLKLMYILIEEARIPHKSAFVEPAIKTFGIKFSDVFYSELKNAIATAR